MLVYRNALISQDDQPLKLRVPHPHTGYTQAHTQTWNSKNKIEFCYCENNITAITKTILFII